VVDVFPVAGTEWRNYFRFGRDVQNVECEVLWCRNIAHSQKRYSDRYRYRGIVCDIEYKQATAADVLPVTECH